LGLSLGKPINGCAVQEMQDAGTAPAGDAVMHEVGILVGSHLYELALRLSHIVRQFFTDATIHRLGPIEVFLGTVVLQVGHLRSETDTEVWCLDDITGNSLDAPEMVLPRANRVGVERHDSFRDVETA